MLSIAAISGARGPGYYLELANINYYAEGGEPLPLWHGTAARALELVGVAEKAHVERLCAGLHHETGEPLVRNGGKEGRYVGIDCTFSAPKSVSVAWAMGDEGLRKAVEEKHLAAVKLALDFLEQKAGLARVGAQGKEHVHANLIFALFEHGTSRAMDPQLHTHALCLNLTVHPDGETTAIDTSRMYEFKMAAGALYRSALAHGMQRLGFSVVQRPIGSHIGFELSCIGQEIMDFYSKRRAEIEEQLKIRTGGLDTADPRYAELICLETRRTKDTEKPRKLLLEEWQAIGKEFGIDAKYLNEQRMPFVQLNPDERARRKEVIFREAISALSEHYSHWNEAELTKHVAERAPGRISPRDVREVIEDKLGSAELLVAGTVQTQRTNLEAGIFVDKFERHFTTPQIRQLERHLLVTVERIERATRSESRRGLVAGAIEAASPALKPDQAEAVRWLCSGPNIRICTGIAGSGKSHLLKTCHEIWAAEGKDVLGCSQMKAAAKRLEKGTEIPSDTVDRLLYRLDRGELSLSARSVLVVDEAGQLGTRHMARLVDHVSKADGARLVLVGDARQLQPISAGGPLRYLSGILKETRLETIFRQEEPWARQAVKDFERGAVREAIASYIERGRFHVADSEPEAMARLIDRWQKDGGVANPERALMLAATHREVNELNGLAQAARIRAGEVDADRKIYAHGVFLHEGDKIQFKVNSTVLDVANSDRATVLSVDPERGRLTVRLDKDRRELTVDLKRYAAKNIKLSYASTVHASQGDSIEAVQILLGGGMTDLHMGYVQFSRGIKSTHVFVDKLTAGGPELGSLIRSLSRERPKTLAQEVIDQERERRQQRQEQPRPEPRRERERGMSLGF